GDIRQVTETQAQAVCPASRWSPRFLARSRTRQSLPWSPSMTAAKSLGSTKSSSASSSKSRATDASLSSSSAMHILYEKMFVKSSVNSHRIVQSLPTQTHHRHPLPSQRPRVYTRPDGPPPTQAHLRPVPGQGTRDLPARAEVRERIIPIRVGPKVKLHLTSAARGRLCREAVEIRSRHQPPHDRCKLEHQHHHINPRRVARNGALEVGGIRLHETRRPKPEARLRLQGREGALALGRDDEVAVIVIGVD